MSKKSLNNNICFILIAISILTICLIINPTSKLSEQGISNFDWWSNDIMIADLMYNKNFDNDKLLQKIITPDIIVESGQEGIALENAVKNKFINNETFSKELFKTYSSNITAHRFIYSIIDKLLNISNERTVFMFEIMNCLLMAIMITIVLYWIKKITNTLVSYILLFVLGFLSPSLMMFGKNLYWIGWSLFLPMVSMILTINNKKFKSIKNRNILLFFIALITCLIKQVFYFEFVTTVMISMMIPIIYYIIEEKLDLKESIKIFIWPTIGALISFVIANLIKLIILSIDLGGVQIAINTIIENFNVRLVGNTTSSNIIIVESANVSFIRVLWIMVKKVSISLKGIMTLTQLATLGGVLAITMLEGFKIIRNKTIYINLGLLICIWISLLAPLSWFILAKPHTYIHNVQCSVTWFIPFTILANAFIIEYCVKIFSKTIIEK